MPNGTGLLGQSFGQELGDESMSLFQQQMAPRFQEQMLRLGQSFDTRPGGVGGAQQADLIASALQGQSNQIGQANLQQGIAQQQAIRQERLMDEQRQWQQIQMDQQREEAAAQRRSALLGSVLGSVTGLAGGIIPSLIQAPLTREALGQQRTAAGQQTNFLGSLLPMLFGGELGGAGSQGLLDMISRLGQLGINLAPGGGNTSGFPDGLPPLAVGN